MAGRFVKWSPGRRNSPGWEIKRNGCHIWTNSRGEQSGGHPSARDPSHPKKQHRPVYVIRYEREIGPIPKGMDLDHFACDGGPKGCVNPHHCRPVSRWENVLRGNSIQAKNRAKTHCKRGHLLAGDNLVRSVFESGRGRYCRTCQRVRASAHYRRRKQRR